MKGYQGWKLKNKKTPQEQLKSDWEDLKKDWQKLKQDWKDSEDERIEAGYVLENIFWTFGEFLKGLCSTPGILLIGSIPFVFLGLLYIGAMLGIIE